MLTLSVKKDEFIVLETLQGLVKIQVTKSTSPGTTKLAIDAPKDINIVRYDLWQEQNPDSDIAKHVPNRIY